MSLKVPRRVLQTHRHELGFAGVFRPICLVDSQRAQKRCERKEGSP